MNVIILSTAGLATGGVRQACYLAAGLQQQGHNVYFAARNGSETKQVALAMGLNCVDLPLTLREANAVLRPLVDRNEPTVVHAFHNKGVKMAAYLGTLWRLQGLPVVCAAHRGVTARPGNVLPYLLPGIRSYMVNSQACARTLPLFWRRNRCLVVNNSVPAERVTPARSASDVRAELNMDANCFVIGAIADHRPQKGAPNLIRAFAQIHKKHPNARLLLIGVAKEKLEPLCKELGVYEYCHMTGRTPHVADYLQLLDLMVFASYFIESQPNVILEGILMDIPVIASNIGGIPEILPKNCLFDPHSVDAIRDKIMQLIAHPERMAEMQAQNAATKPLYSLEHRLQVVTNEYRHILRESGYAHTAMPVKIIAKGI